MPDVTLIMTRKPFLEGSHIVGGVRKSGLFGTMVLVVGARVSAIHDYWIPPLELDGAGNVTQGSADRLVGGFQRNHTHIIELARRPMQPGDMYETIAVAGRHMGLMTNGGAIEVRGEYRTMERYRSDTGALGRDGFLMTRPRPAQPYRLTFEEGNTVVRQLNGDGRCLRVHDHGVMQTNGLPAGILLHNAPHPGWLTGCISPRETTPTLDETFDDQLSLDAMEEIFEAVNLSGGGTAWLYVMDW